MQGIFVKLKPLFLKIVKKELRLLFRKKCRFYYQQKQFPCEIKYYDVLVLEYNNSIPVSLSTAMHPHKWWSTLKTFLFGVNSSLPSIWTDDGSVTYDTSKIAEVFSTVFQNKKSDQELNLQI